MSTLPDEDMTPAQAREIVDHTWGYSWLNDEQVKAWRTEVHTLRQARPPEM